MEIKFGNDKKVGVKLSGLIAGKVELVETVIWEFRLVLRGLQLVDAAHYPAVKKRSRKHMYMKFWKDAFGRMMTKKTRQ